MQDKHLYEYAIIRVVPYAEREEAMNVGVIVYCNTLKYLGIRIAVDAHRISAFAPALDLAELEEHLVALERICCGMAHSGPIGALPIAMRFRWLTATRSTVVQATKVHSGFCSDPQATIEGLHEKLVRTRQQ